MSHSILIVDDSVLIRTAVSKTLLEAGYAVLDASSAREALQILNSSPVALIITDQIMEHMSGSELCRTIRADGRYATLPIISLTSRSDEETIRSIYAAGVSDYIRKPFIAEELLARVRVQLERSTVLQELEQKVHARTHELADTNQALRSEMDEKAKLMESLVQARAAAERASLTKSRFLANISHELRTPLNGILGFSRLALECAPEGELASCLALIQSSSEGVLKVVNDVLEFAKLDIGAVELKIQPFDLYELLEDLRKFFSTDCAAQEKHLTMHHPPNLPRYVVGDELRIRQVFLNLVGNALKFTKDGSHIFVFLEFITTSGDQFELICRVSDHGTGIPQEHLSLIFEPFWQANSSDTRVIGGTGLGLATTAQLVQLMRGSITAASESGIGSTFQFKIPLQRSDTTRPSAGRVGTPKPLCSSIGTVLVVDDNPISQKLLLTLLRKRGITALAAANGEEAVRCVLSQPVAIVLMDCQMPVLDGYEATRQIRALSDATKRLVPIIAVTASALEGDQQRCLIAGMNALVPKPISPPLLFETISRLLHSNQADEAQQPTLHQQHTHHSNP